MSERLPFRVLHRPLCPFCRRLRAYLAEKGLTVDLVTYAPREHHAELCGANPKGQVPTCALPDGLVLYESTIIMQYLEETHPEPPLMPTSPEARARMRLLYDLADVRMPPCLLGFVRTAEDDPERPRFEEGLVGVASDAERLLSPDGPFAEGADFTLADLSVPPLLLRALEAGLAPQVLSPRLRRWCEAVAARPSVRELFPRALAA
jgi:glutathione S-transferase